MRHPDPGLVALTIQQPWAELILRGIKTIEVRTRSCGNKPIIYLYSSQNISKIASAAPLAQRHAIDLADLPTGQVVGTVGVREARKCRQSDSSAACVPWKLMHGKFSWMLENPVRLNQPVSTVNVPYGMWFYPFRTRPSNSKMTRRKHV